MHLEINVFNLCFGFLILLTGVGYIVYLTKWSAYYDGLLAGKGQPTEDLIDRVVDRTIRVLSFISENEGAFFLADIHSLDKEKKKIFCKIKFWNTDGGFGSAPTPGRLYRVTIIFEEGEGVVCFRSVGSTF